jgi:hypothetical protein
MNESEFEAQLRADGYQEIELQELTLGPGKAGTGIFLRSGAWSSRAHFSLPKIAIL